MTQFLDIAHSLRCIVPRYAPLRDKEDYTQEALIAAWKAEKSFKAGRGAGIRTYTAKCISSALLRYKENKGLVHIPNHVHVKWRRIAKAFKRLTTEGVPVTVDNLSEDTGYEREEVMRIMEWFQPVTSLDLPADMPGGGVVKKLASDEDQHELKIGVAQLLELAELTELESLVIKMSYWEDMPQTQIAQTLECSPVTIRRKRLSALAKLRKFEEFKVYLEGL